MGLLDFYIIGVAITIIVFGLCRSDKYIHNLCERFFSSELAADGARQEKFCIDLMVGICFLVHVCVFELVLRNLLGKTESDNFCRNCFLVLCYLLAPFSDFFFPASSIYFWFQAPPPGKLSPDRDGSSDPDADKKRLDSEMDMVST